MKCDNECPNVAAHVMTKGDKKANVCAPHYYIYKQLGYN